MNIEEALDRAEQALAAGGSVKGTGFWKAVDEVRRDAALAERHADRIGTIDRRAFELGVKLRLPAWAGIAALAAASAFGVFVLVLAARAAARVTSSRWLEPAQGIDAYHWPAFVPIAFFVGFGALLVGTHSLAHWIVGRLVGMRFTHVFVAGRPPEPGVKIDYSTYLRTSPKARAVMHASGAVVSKFVPFVALPVALSFYASWPWVTWVLLVIAAVQIVTDILYSTKVSDWKKVLRELRAARG